MENEMNARQGGFTGAQKRYLAVKRGIDFVLSLCAVIVLSPVLLVIALAVKLDSPGPVLFKQRRVGKDKEIFEIWKFRTMRTDTPGNMPTHLLKDPDRYITKTGRFLRKSSLDELPQILQILSGKMSIIGPRPALWNQYDLIAERDKGNSNACPPGLTGWAQVHGRDELEIAEKAGYDNYYADHISFGLDVKCFFATIVQVFRHEGVVEGGTGAMKEKAEK